MIKPVVNGRLTSPYGDRILNGKKQFHPGIDLGSDEEFPIVYNVYTGKVHIAGLSSTFGWRVWVKLTEGPFEGLYAVYAHMLNLAPGIKDGVEVEEGQALGIMGNTGLSFGKHLHFEIRTKPDTTGKSINPEEVANAYVKKKPIVKELTLRA